MSVFMRLRNSMCLSMCLTPEGIMLLLLSVQVGGGDDQTGVGVDAEELVSWSWQQTVPHRSVLVCGSGHKS